MFKAQSTLSGLKKFQTKTVNHVFKRLYTDSPTTDRFLVSDETGLGKSVVAAGLVAKAIEHLESVNDVDRIDIVYMCSNSDLARQNIARINVTGQADVIESGRLSLLPLELGKLNASPAANTTKRVNFISITPGTSFNDSQRLGNSDERAVLYVMLEQILGEGDSRIAPRRFSADDQERALELLRGNSGIPGFSYNVNRTRQRVPKGFSGMVKRGFKSRATKLGLIRRFKSMLHSMSDLDSLREPMRDLIGQMRAVLAEIGLECLEPDLIILDEFQRFQDLLFSTGEESELEGAAELARNFLNYKGAKLLLLSATPYKAHTSGDNESGEDHAKEFRQLLSFLSQDEPQWMGRLDSLLARRRRQLTGIESGDNYLNLQKQLKRYMCRTERPQLSEGDMLRVVRMKPNRLHAEDLRSLTALTAASRAADAGNPIEYWKSVPYFANFLGDYQLGKIIDGTIEGATESLVPLLPSLKTIDSLRYANFDRLESDNAKYREVEEHALGQGQWKLLWMPPSCPYTQPAGAYAAVSPDLTKQLIFSSWNATPNAVSTLLSYEAERKMMTLRDVPLENTAEARKRFTGRFNWRLREGAPSSMSAMALFVPHAALANRTDPLRLNPGDASGSTPSDTGSRGLPVTSDLVASAEAVCRERAGDTVPNDELGLWSSYFGLPGALPPHWKTDPAQARNHIKMVADLGSRSSTSSVEGEVPEESIFMVHAVKMLETIAGPKTGARPGLGKLAIASPANCMYRALGRILPASFDAEEHWKATVHAANGLRALFNRQDVSALLDYMYQEGDYWQHVLQYCLDGNLQSVLDEYVYQLRSQQPKATITAEQLWDIAETIRGALSLTAAQLTAKYPGQPEAILRMATRFAVRYGGGKTEGGMTQRLPEVRRAFNSPFWPFVLATTSVGQEGIDFHWWCHSVIHWNAPSNPVDFEQREGRVNRYMGHAVRKNTAVAHAKRVMESKPRNPWHELFKEAERHLPDLPENQREFAPYWIHPGVQKIERRLLDHPLSRDVPRTARMLSGLASYRLLLGQARQDDLIEALKNPTMQPLNLRP
ncbi:helicase C-terminal domain-containing protein [Paeniglutamicibacter antarcticus]|uniref:Helicase n=1 Tax=Paeniglutamicibacter antarcticus TaxID=494023 RepID=A0ABP9TQ48_9MICC